MNSENGKYFSELCRFSNNIHTPSKAALRGLRIPLPVRSLIPSQLQYWADTLLVHIGPEILRKMALERGARTAPSIGESSEFDFQSCFYVHHI